MNVFWLLCCGVPVGGLRVDKEESTNEGSSAIIVERLDLDLHFTQAQEAPECFIESRQSVDNPTHFAWNILPHWEHPSPGLILSVIDEGHISHLIIFGLFNFLFDILQNSAFSKNIQKIFFSCLLNLFWSEVRRELPTTVMEIQKTFTKFMSTNWCFMEVLSSFRWVSLLLLFFFMVMQHWFKHRCNQPNQNILKNTARTATSRPQIVMNRAQKTLDVRDNLIQFS